jgi:hypothetical protein
MSAALVYLEYAGLAIVGLAAAAAVSKMCLVAAALFLLTGLAYNVEPLRTKDHAYLDVMTESLGNPIRLLLGWAIVASTTLPPVSLMLAYWMGGAFLMAVKRLAEYRTIVGSHGVEVLGAYRRSFRHYTAERLLILSFLCGLMAAFFIAVFLIKYRIEYLLSFPLFALLFAAARPQAGVERADAGKAVRGAADPDRGRRAGGEPFGALGGRHPGPRHPVAAALPAPASDLELFPIKSHQPAPRPTTRSVSLPGGWAGSGLAPRVRVSGKCSSGRPEPG